MLFIHRALESQVDLLVNQGHRAVLYKKVAYENKGTKRSQIQGLEIGKKNCNTYQTKRADKKEVLLKSTLATSQCEANEYM